MTELALKILLIGGAGVGKTSILRRFVERPFRPEHVPTVGVEVAVIPFGELYGRRVMLHLWDVASVELEASGTHHALLTANLAGAFVVFDVSRPETLDAVDAWCRVLSRHVSALVPRILLAHKADLLDPALLSPEALDEYRAVARFEAWAWTVGAAAFGDYVSQRGGSSRQRSVTECVRTMVGAVLRVSGLTSDELSSPDPPFMASPYVSRSRLPDADFLWAGVPPQPELHVRSAAVEFEVGVDDPLAVTTAPRAPEEYTGGGGSDADADADAPASPDRPDRPEPPEQEQVDPGWQHFAGSIPRPRAEMLLMGLEPGSFLVRRRAAATLVLSFVDAGSQVSHARIEFAGGSFFCGKNNAHGPFATLLECLRATAQHAWRGLCFERRPGHRQPVLRPALFVDITAPAVPPPPPPSRRRGSVTGTTAAAPPPAYTPVTEEEARLAAQRVQCAKVDALLAAGEWQRARVAVAMAENRLGF